MAAEPQVLASAVQMHHRLLEWATHCAFNSAPQRFSNQYPLLTCSVDLANRFRLWYKGSIWVLEPHLYPEHCVRLRLTHLPENTAPTLLRTLPVPDGYRSVDEFAAALCLVMDEELRRQTSVVVHEINFQDVIGG